MQAQVNSFMLIGSIALFFAATLLFAGLLGSLLNAQQSATATATTTPPAGAGGTDTTSPSFMVPPLIVIETGGAPDGTLLYEVTALDDVDGTATLGTDLTRTDDEVGGFILIYCNPASGTVLPMGDHTVICSATDAAGNQGTASFIASIRSTTDSLPEPAASSTTSSRDTTPPTLTVPGPMTFETAGRPTALIVYSASAQDDRDGFAALDEAGLLVQDNVGGEILIDCYPMAQYTLRPGTHTIDCFAADAANNTAEASFPVTVTHTPPPGGNIGGISASLSANPPIYEGPCPPPSRPTPMQFIGTITDNVGNRDVTYRFIFSTGGTSGEEVIHFDQPGSQSVSINTTPSLEGWGAIEIIQPVQLQSNRAEFKVTCTPTIGAAPQTLQAENDTTTATAIATDDVEEEDTTTDGAGTVEDTTGTGTDADDTDNADQSPPGGTTTEDDDEEEDTTATTTDAAGGGGGGDTTTDGGGGTGTGADGSSTNDDEPQ